MQQALAASCAMHAQAPAVATCRRCGLFLCDACVALDGDESYCQSCLARRHAEPDWRTKAPMLVALFSLGGSIISIAGFDAVLGLGALLLWGFGLVLRIVEGRKKHESVLAQRWLRFETWVLVVAGLACAPLVLLIVLVLIRGRVQPF